MADSTTIAYELDQQIGFLLRRANQRHTGIFAEAMPPELTPMRFAALAKLFELGTLSQNALGRETAMDIATIKGVVDRLRNLQLIETRPDPQDARRQLIMLTSAGRDLIRRAVPIALGVTAKTVAPLTDAEARMLVKLLGRIC